MIHIHRKRRKVIPEQRHAMINEKDKGVLRWPWGRHEPSKRANWSFLPWGWKIRRSYRKWEDSKLWQSWNNHQDRNSATKKKYSIKFFWTLISVSEIFFKKEICSTSITEMYLIGIFTKMRSWGLIMEIYNKKLDHLHKSDWLKHCLYPKERKAAPNGT